MKKILFIFTLVSALILGSCERDNAGLSSDEELLFVKTNVDDIIPGQYVILLKDGVTSIKSAKLSYPDSKILMRGEVQKVLAASNISTKEPLQVYTASTEGFAVRLSDEEAKALKNNPGVLGVWPDKLIIVGKPVKPSTPLPDEVTPPGITRVGGGEPYNGGHKAWIIDTGIDLDHPELNVNSSLGVNLVLPGKIPDDDNGHGTHCAGIIAAIDNSVGVVGVAPGAEVVPVKVLDRRGSGWMSTIIAGVDYVTGAATPGDVVNMSLGGGAYAPLDIKVEGMGTAGLFVALAAGNEGDDASIYSPARAEGENIYTVSACNSSDQWASFSNSGAPVDYCAPGVYILSLYKNGGMAYGSGTSMAAPHVCGVLLATRGKPKSDGSVTGDPDGIPDPIVHK